MKRQVKMFSLICSARTMLCGVCVLSIFIACFEDDFNATISQENSYIEPGEEPAEILPVPGNNGIIVTSSITDEGLQLSWTKAEDEKTPQAELDYRVFQSSLNNIGTAEGAETNGTPVTDWAADFTSVTVTGLDSGTLYYFNVVARAPDGRKAAYVPASTTTVGVVYMYSAGTHTGKLTTPYTTSARADVDAICAPVLSSATMSVIAVPELKNHRAFISLSAADAIRNFPSRYGVPANWPVKSYGGAQIAWTWADMLDGSINMRLQDAGIANTFWWSGSTGDGGFDGDGNCSGWTDGTSGSQGMEGAHNELSGDWLSRDARNCNNSLLVLCVGW